MAFFRPMLVILFLLQVSQLQTIFFTKTTHFALANHIKVSTISAAPAVLPGPPVYDTSPALSPDIAPLFPSPAKEPISPAESSLPTIPSSPSPPNPDAVAAAGPGAALAPAFGSLESSASFEPLWSFSFAVMVVCCVMWIGIGN